MTVQLTPLAESEDLTSASEPPLTLEWDMPLSDVNHQTVDLSEAAADLVLSTNGLYR